MRHPLRTALSMGILATGVVGFAPATGCHGRDCADSGFDEGERFQITIIGTRPEFGPCSFAPLSSTASFTVVAGETLFVPDNCRVRAARPEGPPFAGDLLTSCEAAPFQLAQTCKGKTKDGCDISARITLSPTIGRGVTGIDEGRLGVDWTISGCMPRVCYEAYDVRIERLPPSSI